MRPPHHTFSYSRRRKQDGRWIWFPARLRRTRDAVCRRQIVQTAMMLDKAAACTNGHIEAVDGTDQGAEPARAANYRAAGASAPGVSEGASAAVRRGCVLGYPSVDREPDGVRTGSARQASRYRQVPPRAPNANRPRAAALRHGTGRQRLSKPINLPSLQARGSVSARLGSSSPCRLCRGSRSSRSSSVVAGIRQHS